jgi:hypothetical protein
MCIDAKPRPSWCAFQNASCWPPCAARVVDVDDRNPARFHRRAELIEHAQGKAIGHRFAM